MTEVELLERDDELRLLGRAWQEARGGEGSIVLLAGESGIGKTSLARLFATGPHVGDVLWGVCDPLGVPRPLGPLHDVADVRVGGEQAGQRGLPDPRLAGEQDDRAFAAPRLLPGAAQETQLVVALEQLHPRHGT